MEEKIIKVSRETDEISLKELVSKFDKVVGYLLSKWLIIVCFIGLGSLVGFSYAKFKRPVYTAITSFVLDSGDQGGGMGQYAGLASMVGIDLGSGGGGGIFSGDNILELYKSRTMIEKTLLTEIEYDDKKQLLVDRYIDFNKLREIWAKKPGLSEIRFKTHEPFTRLQDSVLGVIANEITKGYLKVAKPDKTLSIIRVEVKSYDEVFAKAFNDEIVKNVNDFYVQTKTKKSLNNVMILQQKTDSVTRVMNGAIYSGAIATDVTPNLNPTRQVQRVVPVQRSQFTAETNKAILVELVKNLELSKISLRKETPLIQVIDKPIFPLSKESLGKLKGLVIGGVLGGFIVCLVLIIRRLFKGVLV